MTGGDLVSVLQWELMEARYIIQRLDDHAHLASACEACEQLVNTWLRRVVVYDPRPVAERSAIVVRSDLAGREADSV